MAAAAIWSSTGANRQLSSEAVKGKLLSQVCSDDKGTKDTVNNMTNPYLRGNLLSLWIADSIQFNDFSTLKS